MQEETGLVIVPSKILGVFGGTEFRYVYPNGDQVEYTVIVNLPANSSRFTGQQFLQWKCPINEFNRIRTVSMEHLVADKLEWWIQRIHKSLQLKGRLYAKQSEVGNWLVNYQAPLLFGLSITIMQALCSLARMVKQKKEIVWTFHYTSFIKFII